MNLHSIRWQLPFSYALVALLAAISLGSVMLLVLNNYYTRLEHSYLLGNALALQPIVERTLQTDPTGETIQTQASGLGFISQTQIRVLGPDGQTLADSGVPDPKRLIALSGANSGMMIFSAAADTTSAASPTDPSAAIPATAPDAIISINSAPLGGYDFAVDESTFSAERSKQIVTIPLQNSLGSLEISNGPAYGNDILRAVALAWSTAGLIAVALAAWAGWHISKRVTQPVLALTEASQRMENGELSTRVALPGEKQQEFIALARAFNAMAGQMENTVATLREFVSDAAHELNTPLTALKTNLELAAAEPDLNRCEHFLARAIEQNQRLETLTHSLLDLSRIEAAQAPLEPVDLCQLVAETGERFASRAEQAERSFTLLMPENTVTISGNQRQLERALGNLLENALKFTPPGGTITLKLEADATLSVSDTGIGIRPDDLPQLFKRFHRGHNAADYAGNGLGLAIVKAVMDAHAGTVHAESCGPGCGSTFTLVFPGLTIPAKV